MNVNKNVNENVNMEDRIGYIHRTESFGAVDGPGLRFVFFLQGCPLRCLYCHNPDTVTFGPGRRWTAEQAADEALRYRSYIKDGGVTFSGGEPLCQPDFIEAVALLLKEEDIHTAVDTSGCFDLDAAKGALDAVDLVLLDIKADEPVLSKALTGSPDPGAYALLEYLDAIGKPVWIRHVLLKGYTLDEDRLIKIADSLTKYRNIERVELLPFHKLGEPKWADTGRDYLLSDTPATTPAEKAWAKEIFERRGFVVQ